MALWLLYSCHLCLSVVILFLFQCPQYVQSFLLLVSFIYSVHYCFQFKFSRPQWMMIYIFYFQNHLLKKIKWSILFDEHIKYHIFFFVRWGEMHYILRSMYTVCINPNIYIKKPVNSFILSHTKWYCLSSIIWFVLPNMKKKWW